MDEPAGKRFRPSQVPFAVDLTLSSDGDSDDDIIITGIRQIGKTPARFNPQLPQNLQALQSMPATGRLIPLSSQMTDPVPRADYKAPSSVFLNTPADTPQRLLTASNSGSSSSLNSGSFDMGAVQHLSAAALVPNASALANGKVATSARQSPASPLAVQAVDEPEVQLISHHLAHSPTQSQPKMAAKFEDVTVHNNGSLETTGGHFFNSTVDVTKREQELRQRLDKYKKGLEVIEYKKRKRPERQVELKRKKDQLLRMGISEDNIKVKQIIEAMNKLSAETREHASKEKQFKIGIDRAIRKLNHFVQNEKPDLLRIIMERENMARHKMIENERKKHHERLQIMAEREQLLRQAHMSESQRALLQHQQRNGLHFGMMDGVMNAIDGISAYQRRLLEVQEQEARRIQMLAAPGALNAYNTDDLVHLLESVKKQEEQEIEGESNTPDELTVNLLKHQRIGLRWLEDAEDDKKKRGGILADAMGLGKTVQLIGLMMSHRADKTQDEDAAEYGKTNLVVAPVSLINQWKSEFETKIKESIGVSVLMYHSMAGKTLPWDQMQKYDVVMTSYGTLSSELRKHCINTILSDDQMKLRWAPNLTRVNQYKAEHGGYISPFYSSESKFYRVVLDEAQNIKSKFTRASIAAHCVVSWYRWCLSGTPMQNNVSELYPLLRFLRIRPYCEEQRFKDDISAKLDIGRKGFDEIDRDSAIKKLRLLLRSLMLRREKDSKIDGKPILDLPEKKIIVYPTLLSSNENEHTFYMSIENQAAMKVKKILNGPIAKGEYSYILLLLLRLRQACLHSELVRIGDRKKGVIYDDDGNVISTTTVESMCKFATKFNPDVARRLNEADSDRICPVCVEQVPEERLQLFYPCGHSICKGCSSQFFDNFQQGVDEHVRVADCPKCRLQVKENEIVDYEIFDRHVNKNQSVAMLKVVYDEKSKNAKETHQELESLNADNLEFSPKIASVVKLVKEIWSKNSDDKIIVFSHFTSFFSIMKKFLLRENIEVMEYLGSLNATQRNEVVKEFYRDVDKKLLLISLKAGNAGLTLTCANHVIIMDPFWNPYVEFQAQDRCHRIGQQKPVTVYRMLIEGTVEDRILELQEKKKDIIESAMDPTGMKEASKLSRDDIARLFNIGQHFPAAH